MRIDSPIVTGSLSVNGDSLLDLNTLTTTGSNTFVGNQSIVGAVSASSLTGSLDYSNIINTPTLISGSSQVISILSSLNSYTQSNDTTNQNQNNRLNSIEGVTGSYETNGRGLVSGSSQVTPLLPTGTVSGSSQVIGILDSLNSYTSSVKNAINVIGEGTASVTTVYGNLVVEGTTLTVSASNLAVADNMIYLNDGNEITNPDLGIVGNYNDGTYSHAGIFSDASDSHTWKVYKGYTPEPSQSIDITHGSFTLADFQAATLKGSIAATNGVVSGSSQITYANISSIPVGIVSGSSQVIGILSSLNEVSASLIAKTGSLATTGSNTFFANQIVSGNILITGSVGIGITNPTYKLDIIGNSGTTPSMRISANYGGGGLGMIHLTSTGDEGGGITYEKTSGTAQKWKLGCGNTGAFFLYNETSGSQPLTINTNGNIGIGTASTTASDVRLEVYKAAVTGNWSPRLVVKDQNFASFLGIFNQKAGVFAHTSALDGWADLYVNTVDGGFGSGNNGKVIFGGMCILANGNVGIGVTDPAWKLHIQGTTGTSIQDALMTLKNTAASNTTGILFVNSGNTSSYNDLAGIYAKIQSGSAKGYLGFYTRNSDASNTDVAERMRISAEGYVGINRTDPTFRLHVSEIGTTISSGIAISTSTMKGLRIDNTNNSNESVGVWFNTGGSHWSGISGQRTGTGGVEGWATDLRFYTHETNTVDLTYARERMRISADGYVTKPYQPAFKAGRSSNISVGANSTIVFNDTGGIHFNIGGHYNTSNGMFTAPVAGVYIFSACVIYQSLPNGQAMDDAFYIYRNSSLVAYSFRRAEYEAGYTGNGAYYVDHANILLNLAAGDTVSIRNNRALDVHGNTAYCYFYGYMLG